MIKEFDYRLLFKFFPSKFVVNDIIQKFNPNYFDLKFEQKKMFQGLLYKVEWMIWYTKYKMNIGSKTHTITMSLGSVKSNQDANTKTNVYICAYGNGIKASFQPFELDHLHSNLTTDFDTVSNAVLPLDISTLSLHRPDINGESASEWFVKWIEIDKATNPRFSFYKWMKRNSYYSRRSDTILPQDEGNLDSIDNRRCMLDDKRNLYEFELFNNDPALPVKIKEIPSEETFSYCYELWKLLFPRTIMQWQINLSQKFLPDRWNSFKELDDAYKWCFKIPTGIANWDSDVHFAQQRLNQCNWSLIERVTSTDKLKTMINVDDKRLTKVMNAGIVDMISNKSLFIANLKLTEELPIPSPVILFQQTNNRGLIPVAIQLYQRNTRRPNPVFYPNSDKNLWTIAKLWSNLADASIHLGVVHLGLTHLLMEGVDISVHRNLSTRHPIYKLLVPHFYYNLAINQVAREDMLDPGEYVDETMKIKTKGVLLMLANKLKEWRMDIDGTLPEDLKRRNLLCEHKETDYQYTDKDVIIPDFLFAKDGLRIYYAVRNYVEAYVRYYYSGEDEKDTERRLLNDSEIQSFCSDLVKARASEEGGVGIKGVPCTDGKFVTIEQLRDTLTSIIFICTVMHAATNFPQYDEYGFPPNYSTLLHGSPPEDTEKRSEQDILDCIPSVRETFIIMKIFNLLSQETTNSLGNFEVEYIEDPEAVEILEKFRADLRKIQGELVERNEQNEGVNKLPYTRLLPENIPNSIAI